MAFRLLRVVETSPQSILEPSPHPQPVGSTVDLSVVDILSKRGHTLCGAGAQPPSHTARVGAVVTCQQFVPSPVPPSPPAQTDPVVFVRHPLVGAGWSGALDPLMLRFGAGGGPGGCGGWAGNAPRALSPVSQRRLSWPWLCRGGWLRKGGPEAEPRGGVPGALALSLGDRSDPDGVPLLPHAHVGATGPPDLLPRALHPSEPMLWPLIGIPLPRASFPCQHPQPRALPSFSRRFPISWRGLAFS